MSLKVLQIHNRYLIPGGEDAVVASERALLEKNGYRVIPFETSNESIQELPVWRKPWFLFRDACFNPRTYRAARTLIAESQPDLAHIHNTFLWSSPSVYQACFEAGIGVVQTLHNFRFLCPAGTFFRDGHVCEDCVETGLGASVRHRCWRGSYPGSMAMKRTVERFDKDGAIIKKIRLFVTPSEFSRGKFIESGWDPRRIVVKPNCIENPDEVPRFEDGEYALFVGGLFDYKGIRALLAAWAEPMPFQLKIAGDGPLEGLVREAARGPRVQWLGRLRRDEVIARMKGARCVIVPSECYETFSCVIAEAFACGVPVIASDHGAMRELVKENLTGFLFTPADPVSLRKKVHQLADTVHDGRYAAMVRAVREKYEKELTPERNFRLLEEIYHRALAPAETGGEH